MYTFFKTLIQLVSWFVHRKAYDTGLLEDPRTQIDKNKDWLHEEKADASKVTDPFGNQKITQSPYFYENQNQTSSCVPHGVGLALAIERKADLGTYTRIAQMFPYRLRSTYPNAGAYPQEIFEIYRTKGTPLFTSLPTPYSEAEANAITLTQQMYDEAQIFKGLEYYTVKNCNDITMLATIASQGHAVAIVIYAQVDEWATDYVKIINQNLSSSAAPVRHCICVLPNSGFIENGVKYVTVQDSAWFGGKTLRYLPEDFVQKRVYNAGYWDKVSAIGQGDRPKHTFTIPLKYGASGDEVRNMQQLFVSEGLLPSTMVSGYFAGRTLAALHAFQDKYASDILIPSQLTKPTDLWGYMCIKKANQLCNSL